MQKNTLSFDTSVYGYEYTEQWPLFASGGRVKNRGVAKGIFHQ